MNGTMISARHRVLIYVTFLKHFALELWVSICDLHPITDDDSVTSLCPILDEIGKICTGKF